MLEAPCARLILRALVIALASCQLLGRGLLRDLRHVDVGQWLTGAGRQLLAEAVDRVDDLVRLEILQEGRTGW